MTMTIRSLAITGSLAALSLWPAPAASVHNESRDLLRDLRDQAADAADHATELASLTQSAEASWQSHAGQLLDLKDDVNAMGKEMARLESLRGSAAPWERKAIDESLPLLQKMAADTQAAIKMMDANRNSLWRQSYRDLTGRLENTSDQLVRAVSRVVKFDSVRAREQRLEEEIGISAGS